MKRLQVSEPFVRISSCLVNYSRWARFSSDSPAMLVTRSADMIMTRPGIKLTASMLCRSFSSFCKRSLKIVSNLFSGGGAQKCAMWASYPNTIIRAFI